MPWKLSNTQEQRCLEKYSPTGEFLSRPPASMTIPIFLGRNGRILVSLKFMPAMSRRVAMTTPILPMPPRKSTSPPEHWKLLFRPMAVWVPVWMHRACLDALGIWNYVAKTTLTGTFPKNSGLTPRYYGRRRTSRRGSGSRARSSVPSGSCAMHSIEGRADDGRQVVDCGVGRSVETGDIVVAVADQVGAVLGRDAGRHRRAAWVGAVVGPGGDQHLALAAGGARHHQADGGGVGAVLLEQHPVGVRAARHEALGQFDQARGRAVEAVAQRLLAPRRRIDLRMVVAQQVRAPTAHEVDVGIAVHIPNPAALPVLEELRVARRQRRRVQMARHSAWQHLGCALAPPGVLAVGQCLRGNRRHSESLAVGDALHDISYFILRTAIARGHRIALWSGALAGAPAGPPMPPAPPPANGKGRDFCY